MSKNITVVRIPSYTGLSTNGNGGSAENAHKAFKSLAESDVAIWFHSSGTSSGLPKAIPQTHAGLVAALPSFPGDEKPATFSTTPLYHGGLVDALRAWSSGAMIWFFPEGTAPITGTNIVKAVDFARATETTPVGYFSSVPYILQILADEASGLSMLKSMDLVGVGGAALPEVTGNSLVNHDVRLLSRMGSAECGFLMSSHRNYTNDENWQFLRPISDTALLDFEPQEDGLFELVVKPWWPHLAKVNREDGSYATSDLFEPHPQITGAWRYHSRADAQITLSNGKKFDPSPLEASIVASTTLLQDVLVFGDSRDYPGALLLPAHDVEVDGLSDSVWPTIERLNRDTQSHARISRSMVVVAEPGEQGLEKSSKGTIMRRAAEARFATDIEKAYTQPQAQSILSTDAPFGEVYSIVAESLAHVLGRDVDPEKDLYGQGVDSIACIQIRTQLQNACLPTDSRPLPLNIVYDQATVTALTSYLWRLRQRSSNGETHEDDEGHFDTQLRAMASLATKYNSFAPLPTMEISKDGKYVVLTGSTGFLGSHILRYLLLDEQVRGVFCLIRASSAEAARDRLEAAMKQRGLAELIDHRVICVPCDLAREDLGMSPGLQSLMTKKATLVIHSAWTVNFSLKISSFEGQIRGTVNLLDFAAQANARMAFISSTAAVTHAQTATIPEGFSLDPADSSPLGYSQSKWVAEQICAAAADRVGPSGPFSKRHTVLVIRVGQLCGDESGIWSASEAYPLMLSTAGVIGSLPDIKGEVVNWLPVHLAAQAVLDIAFHDVDQQSPDQSPVFHVVNYHNSPSWGEMLRWLQGDDNNITTSPSFEVLPAAKWVTALEEASQQGGTKQPAYALLALWKNAFSAADDTLRESSATPRTFDTSRSQQVSDVMRDLQPLDRAQVLNMWRWVKKTLP